MALGGHLVPRTVLKALNGDGTSALLPQPNYITVAVDQQQSRRSQALRRVVLRNHHHHQTQPQPHPSPSRRQRQVINPITYFKKWCIRKGERALRWDGRAFPSRRHVGTRIIFASITDRTILLYVHIVPIFATINTSILLAINMI
jgi:hypothetical protein